MELPSQALWRIFADGARVTTSGGTLLARTLDVGNLILPTGRIVASDPFLDPWNGPFSTPVPAGIYPIFASMIDNDIAAIMVSFGDAAPTIWRAAEPRMFSVDSATGCLMDQKVCRFLRRKAEADKYWRYTDRFHAALDEVDGLAASYCIDAASGANVILFHTRGGDGYFPSFFGYAANRSPVCLVIDMYLAFETVLAVEAA